MNARCGLTRSKLVEFIFVVGLDKILRYQFTPRLHHIGFDADRDRLAKIH